MNTMNDTTGKPGLPEECAYCGREMTRGYLISSGPLCFTLNEDQLLLFGKNVTLLGSFANTRRWPAVWCAHCNLYMLQNPKVK